jgi:hypothetical protein
MGAPTNARRRPIFRSLDDGRSKLYRDLAAAAAAQATRGALPRRRLHRVRVGRRALAPPRGAFARRQGASAIVTLAPRLCAGSASRPGAAVRAPSVWGDTRIDLPFFEEGTSCGTCSRARAPRRRGGLRGARSARQRPVCRTGKVR